MWEEAIRYDYCHTHTQVQLSCGVSQTDGVISMIWDHIQKFYCCHPSWSRVSYIGLLQSGTSGSQNKYCLRWVTAWVIRDYIFLSHVCASAALAPLESLDCVHRGYHGKHTPSQWANGLSWQRYRNTESPEREMHSGLDNKTMEVLMCSAANQLLSVSLGHGIDDVGSTGYCGVLAGAAQVSQCGSFPERVSSGFFCMSNEGSVKGLFSKQPVQEEHMVTASPINTISGFESV